MIEMECAHWLDYDKWLERENDHKIEKQLQNLEIAALKSKLSAIKEAVESIPVTNRMSPYYARMQNLGMSGMSGLGRAAGYDPYGMNQTLGGMV